MQRSFCALYLYDQIPEEMESETYLSYIDFTQELVTINSFFPPQATPNFQNGAVLEMT